MEWLHHVRPLMIALPQLLIMIVLFGVSRLLCAGRSEFFARRASEGREDPRLRVGLRLLARGACALCYRYTHNTETTTRQRTDIIKRIQRASKPHPATLSVA